MESLKTIGPQTSKPYKCSECGAIENHTTNHWGQFYMTRCQTCKKSATWDCQEQPPEGFKKSADWNTATVGDIFHTN